MVLTSLTLGDSSPIFLVSDHLCPDLGAIGFQLIRARCSVRNKMKHDETILYETYETKGACDTDKVRWHMEEVRN